MPSPFLPGGSFFNAVTNPVGEVQGKLTGMLGGGGGAKRPDTFSQLSAQVAKRRGRKKKRPSALQFQQPAQGRNIPGITFDNPTLNASFQQFIAQPRA